MDKNPMQEVLRRQLGMDAFALDGDDTDIPDPWQPNIQIPTPPVAPRSAQPAAIFARPDEPIGSRGEPRIEIRRKF